MAPRLLHFQKSPFVSLNYLPGRRYITQENAWMDMWVWREYLCDVGALEMGGPSVIMVDNLDSHVSIESSHIVSGKLSAFLAPLPPNFTSVC